MPTLGIVAGQIMRSNAFTLTGNTQATQIASMTGIACMTDWLSIPCATNLGRLPSPQMTCVDRLCGGSFNAENQNLNGSSVISKYNCRNIYLKSFSFAINNIKIFKDLIKIILQAIKLILYVRHIFLNQ